VEPGWEGRDADRLGAEGVIAAMRERLNETLSLEAMAEMASVSPYHFVRVFRRDTGLPPGEFMAALRLQEAKRLLLTTGLSVTDVCFEVGYRSLGTFTTRFTQLVGVSPGRLRRLAGEVDAYLVPPRQLPVDPRVDVTLGGLSGRITAPDLREGLIFVGLFPSPIPQSRPVACTVLTAPGPYHIAAVPNGRYYVLAAGFPTSTAPLARLLPDAGARVGNGGVAHVWGGEAVKPVDIALRPLRPLDPPLLAALPFLGGARQPRH